MLLGAHRPKLGWGLGVVLEGLTVRYNVLEHFTHQYYYC